MVISDPHYQVADKKIKTTILDHFAIKGLHTIRTFDLVRTNSPAPTAERSKPWRLLGGDPVVRDQIDQSSNLRWAAPIANEGRLALPPRPRGVEHAVGRGPEATRSEAPPASSCNATLRRRDPYLLRGWGSSPWKTSAEVPCGRRRDRALSPARPRTSTPPDRSLRRCTSRRSWAQVTKAFGIG